MTRGSAPNLNRLPFAIWLRDQVDRGGAIGQLARQMRGDRAIAHTGNVTAVRSRLHAMRADKQMLEVLDDAEIAWLAS